MIHELKTINLYFQEVWDLRKNFELRKNDRNYKQFDEVVLREFDPEKETYSGREIRATISYVLSNKYMGLNEDVVILALKNFHFFNENLK